MDLNDPRRLRLELVADGAHLRPALLERLLGQLELPGRIVTLEGAPGVFCEGLDFDWVAGADDSAQDFTSFARLLAALERTGRPVVALVDGPALGGGCALAAAADLVIATPRATFGLPEVLWGLIPALAFPVLARRMNVTRARLLGLGIPALDAAEAQRWGLVDLVVPDLEAAFAVQARRLLRADPRAVAELKALVPDLGRDDYTARASASFQALAASEGTRRRIAKFGSGDLPWEDEE